MSSLFAGIDIGGTYVKGVLVDKEKVLEQTTRETRDGDHQWQAVAMQVLEELSIKAPSEIEGVGLSAPGITDADNRQINYMPGRLEGLEGFDWSAYLKRKVHVLNDAHAALLAESRWGAAKNISNVVMLTLGTGVGGGLLIDGKLLQGYLQRAGHLGHISIDSSSEQQDITGITGSLEDAVGEATLSDRSNGRFSNSKDLVQAYMEGDIWATYVWLTSLRKLALGIVSFCNTISPHLIVLAGGITKAGEQLTQPLSAFMELYEWRPDGMATPIKLAEYHEFAGAIGAALFTESQTGVK